MKTRLIGFLILVAAVASIRNLASLVPHASVNEGTLQEFFLATVGFLGATSGSAGFFFGDKLWKPYHWPSLVYSPWYSPSPLDLKGLGVTSKTRSDLEAHLTNVFGERRNDIHSPTRA